MSNNKKNNNILEHLKNNQILKTIKTLRKKNKYTQKEIANILEVSQEYYSRCEQGKGEFKMTAIEKLIAIYGINEIFKNYNYTPIKIDKSKIDKGNKKKGK